MQLAVVAVAVAVVQRHAAIAIQVEHVQLNHLVNIVENLAHMEVIVMEKLV